MALGELDAGKPPVQFDEGRSETVIGLCLSIRPLRLLYSISQSVAVVLAATLSAARAFVRLRLIGSRDAM